MTWGTFALGRRWLALPCFALVATPALAQSSFAARTHLDWTGVLTGAFLGFLLLPVIYNAAFFAILRERFLIWQGVRALIILALTISLSSLPLGSFLAGDGFARQVVINVLFDLSVGISGPFLRSYVEPGMLGQRMYRFLGWTLPLALLTTPAMLMPDCPPLYMAFRNLYLVGFLLLQCFAFAQAIQRGSRAARFQAVAWAGLFTVCGVSLFHDVVLDYPFANFLFFLFAALALEVVITAIGIGDRMLRLKKEHDEAQRGNEALHVLANTDPLTGLANRRSLEERFISHPPTAIAIIDLDHFKAINDTFGHDTGDDVLKIASTALSSGAAFVARLGGEEFAILLYSTHAFQEAETLRNRIPQHIVRQLNGLDSPVTASMGVAVLTSAMSFGAAIKLADIALYQAKASGRNRAVEVESNVPVPTEFRVAA